MVTEGMFRLPAIYFFWRQRSQPILTGRKQQKPQSSKKIDIPSVIDVNKNKNKHDSKREVN